MNTQKQEWPIVAIVALGLFIISFSANIAFSLHHGRLSHLPLYDDVAYLADSLQRFYFDRGRGFRSIISSFLASPPHAPFSTLTAMSGFWLFGPQTIAPYLANAWILGVFVFAITAISRPISHTAQRILFISLFLFAPAAHAMVNEFRPDMAAGLLFGLALYAVCTVDLVKADLRKRMLIGLLAAIATIAKPSAIIVTLPFLGAATCIAIALNARRPGQSVSGIVKRAAPSALAYIIIITLFAIVWGKKTYGYIYQALVSNADIWGTPGSTFFHWTYHSFGQGGSLALGPLLLFSLLICVWDAASLLIRRRNDPDAQAVLAVYALLIVLYCGMSMSNEKTVFQGSLFYLPLLICTAHALTRRVSAINAKGLSFAATAGLGLFVGYLALSSPFASTYTKPAKDGKQASTLLEAVTLRIVQETSVLPETCRREKYTILTTNPDPLSPDAIAYAMALHGLQTTKASTFFARDLETAEKQLSRADFIFSPDADAPNLNRHLPGSAFMGQLNEKLRSDPDWTVETIGNMSGHPMFLAIRKCQPPK